MSDLLDEVPAYNYGLGGDDDVPAYGYGMGLANAEYDVATQLPDAFLDLLVPCRYKVFHGGRGSGKSWSMAIALIMISVTQRKRILCCREYQSSIGESVHYMLVDRINAMGLNQWFVITNTSIFCPATGSEFIFKGLKLHINEIKSTEAVDICFIEEGQSTSKESWRTLDPTIRKGGSEIWIAYNPLNDTDIIHQTFVIKRREDPASMPEYLDGKRWSMVRQVNYMDNPFFNAEMDRMRRVALNQDQDIYAHVWLGETLQRSEAMIMWGKWECLEFEAPEGTKFRFGADWGFSQDPTVLIRCWIKDKCLWIDYEVFAYKTDINEISGAFAGNDPYSNPPRWPNKKHFAGIPGAATWPIKGDNSQPAIISYLANEGLRVSPADKWPGSVEDGIAHLRAFNKIYIHPRCIHLLEEALMYRYKVDKQTGLVLPKIVDEYNHGWDAVRYSLDGFIQRRGAMGIWAQLGKD